MKEIETDFETIYENYRIQLMRKKLLIEMDDTAKLWDDETRRRIIGERDTLSHVVYGLTIILKGIRENE